MQQPNNSSECDKFMIGVAPPRSAPPSWGSGRQICRSVFVAVALCAMLLMSVCGSSVWAESGDDQHLPAPEVQQPPANQPVAVVNGQTITVADLEAHAAVSSLSPEYALEDLVDLILMRAAAIRKGVRVPAGVWSAEQRAGIELALAQAFSLDVAVPRRMLVVDHAWLKDADNEKERANGLFLMKRLRTLVVAGATIPNAFTSLQVDGTDWHIGDHEEYPFSVIPAETRDLSPSSLSGIIPGDGGLHLFKIHQQKQIPPTSDEIRAPLRERLRRDAVIERVEQTVQ